MLFDNPFSVIVPFVPPQVVGWAGVAEAITGTAFTITLVVPAGDVQPFAVAVTEYIPEAEVVTAANVGFWAFDANGPGPVQLYVAPAIVGVFKDKVLPAQTGLLLDAIGMAGMGFTIMLTVPGADMQPFTVAVTK